MAAETTSYGANNMRVLEGLEAVRKRPGMYIGSTGPNGLHHCVWEVVDNSVDEAMAGHCDRIDVTILPDGACRVVDNGRGIPTDLNKQQGMTGVEIALTKLHGGGKFDGEGYKVSGGLHGVGVSVVNALSRKVIVEVDRDGKHHVMEFADGGKPQGKLEVTGDAPNGRTGTTVTFWPDDTIFETVEFTARTILERLQMMAFLNRGLEIRFQDQRISNDEHKYDNERVTYKYAGGISDFVRHINKTKEALWSKVGYFEGADDTSEVEIAFQWNTGLQPRRHPQLRQRHLHHRGRHPRGGLQDGPHPGGEQLRQGQPARQRQGPGPHRRRRPRGPHRRGRPCACRSRSSRARPRPSSATRPCGRWSPR